MFRRIPPFWWLLSAAFLLPFLLAACQGSPPTGPALIDPEEVERIPFDRLSGKIAFRRELPGQDFVSHVMLIDASERSFSAVVTFPQAVVSNLDWSPNGDNLAFAFFPLYGPSPTIWQVYIMPAAGGTAFPLTTEPDHSSYPSWAPDGHRIAYWSAWGGSSLWVADLETGGHQRLFDIPWDVRTRPAWTPDGNGLVVAGMDSLGHATFYLVELDTLRATPLFSAEEPVDRLLLKSPTLSSDGSRLAFVYFTVDSDLPDEIWVMDMDGGDPHPLTGGHQDWNPAWSPDGRQLIFSREGHLMIIRADGSDLSAVTSGAADDEYPAWVGG